MRQIVLCDGPVKVAVSVEGDKATLTMSNGEFVQFTLSKSHIRAVLDGDTVQISKGGVFCKLTRRGDIIVVSFAWKTRHEQTTCSAQDVQDLLTQMEERETENA